LGGSSGSSPLSLPSPLRVRIPDTVESGIESVSAISAALIRSRRRAAITARRRSSVRAGTERGAEERSSSPGSPCSRQQRSHLETVRTLTPTASAVCASVHPSSSTRRTIRRRLCGQVLALP
jgi:hypothetical protein